MAGSSKKTISGTTTAVIASVRSGKAQLAIFGPASQRSKVMEG